MPSEENSGAEFWHQIVDEATSGRAVIDHGQVEYREERTQDSSMDQLAALELRIGNLETRLKEGIDGIRHMQTVGLAVIGLFVAIVGLLVTVGIFEIQNLNSSVGATNVRLDHQIEQQAASSASAQAAANDRMDRLLELYAGQVRGGGAPVAGQQPAPAPSK